MVVSETRNGVESDYVSVTLGSTIGLLNSAGIMTDRWEYWPYGEVVSRTGTSVTPLTFLGVLGYFQDVLGKLFYVTAWHSWTGYWNADPLLSISPPPADIKQGSQHKSLNVQFHSCPSTSGYTVTWDVTGSVV